MANAVKSTARYIRRNPETEEADILRDLCLTLESGGSFDLSRLFDMKPKAFALALELLEEWRFDRHVSARRLQRYLDLDQDQED